MKKFLKIGSIVLGAFISLLIVGWVILYIYFVQHKKSLIQKASTEISGKIKASVTIKDAGITWFSSFPYLSIDLQDVGIVDTTYSKHAVPFLKVDEFLVSCNLLELLKGEVHLSRIALKNGAINVYRDTTGVINLSILDDKSSPKKDQSANATPFSLLTLDNIQLLSTDKTQYRKMDIMVKHLTCNASMKDSIMTYKVDMTTRVDSIGFYIKDGYYGKNKEIDGKFPITFNANSKALALDHITLMLDHEPVEADGVFHLDTAQKFHLHLVAKNIGYNNAIGALLGKTKATLANIKTEDPIDIDISMQGDTKYLSVPHVYITWQVKDDQINTAGLKLSHCSLSGSFSNEAKPNAKRNDANSIVTIKGFHAKWNGTSEISSDKIEILNLVTPMLHVDIHAFCKLTDIDSIVQSNDFNLEEGNADINMVYEGPLNDSFNTVPSITGSFAMQNAEFLYAPRNMRLVKCNALIKFKKTEVSVENFSGKLGNSLVSIKAHVNSFAPLFAHNGKEIALQCSVSSPLIDVGQLMPLLANRKTVRRKPSAQKAILAGLSQDIDQLIDQCSVQANFFAKKITYKRFEADDVDASLELINQQGWDVKNLMLRYAGGNIQLKGNLLQQDNDMHSAALHVIISHVDVSKIFYAFNNFGMVSFDYTNLKGKVSLQSDLALKLDNQGGIVPNSMKGTAYFSLEQGELVNFKPIEDVCSKIFPNRNFRDIQFSGLHDKFSVANRKITMDKMEISSNLLHMYIDGIYDLAGNTTNLTIQVPVKNIIKPDYYAPPDNVGVDAKNGLSVYVHASSDATGKISFAYSFTEKPQENKRELRKEKRRKRKAEAASVTHP